MPTFNNLPGTIVNIQDGGLTTAVAPTDDAILIIGTSGQGVANSPYQVFDRSAASQEFGVSGSIPRAIEECATYSDNIIAFRMGTKQMSLANVGKDLTTNATTPGFSMTFGDVTSDAGTRYKIWYKSGVMTVWKDNEIQFSNQSGSAVDTGDVSITGAIAGNVGLTLGSGSTPILSAAITVTAAAALTGSADNPAPTLTAPVDGTALTGRQLYIAFSEALELLAGVRAKIVYAPDGRADAPNVAYYVSADSTTAANNPATNANALDWLKITSSPAAPNVYQWASETLDSTGATVSAMSAGTAALRITAGFHEVNWPTAIGNFCNELTQLGYGAFSVGIIGTSGPASVKLTDTRKWIGFLPTYDVNGNPATAGSGLLGIPLLTGTTATKMNPLCSDYANGFRVPGMFVTVDGTYDGVIVTDNNGNPVDAGAHVHVVGDWAFMSNGWQANYVQNLAGLVAGYLSALDPSKGLTNKPVKATQIWQPTPIQLDALTQAKISVLRFKGVNVQPALLHDLTAATSTSDYTNFVRVRCLGLVIQTLVNRANNYIGSSSLDGLTLVSMKTQLDQDLVLLTQRGYCNHSTVVVTSTVAQQKIGHATLTLIVHPADELIQLTANVGVGQ